MSPNLTPILNCQFNSTGGRANHTKMILFYFLTKLKYTIYSITFPTHSCVWPITMQLGQLANQSTFRKSGFIETGNQWKQTENRQRWSELGRCVPFRTFHHITALTIIDFLWELYDRTRTLLVEMCCGLYPICCKTVHDRGFFWVN